MEAPAGVTVDALGNLYIADGTEHVRKANVNGIISTIAGNAGSGYSGDGGPVTTARLSEVYGLAMDAFGDLYVATRATTGFGQSGHTGLNCHWSISAWVRRARINWSSPTHLAAAPAR